MLHSTGNNSSLKTVIMENTTLSTLEIFRWIVRIISAALILLFVFIFFGGTINDAISARPIPFRVREIFQVILMFTGLLGLGVAWKWEFTGGLISVLAYVILWIFNPSAIVFPMLLFPATALLFLVLWWFGKDSAQASRQENMQT
jgi:hypothetical protein